MISQKYIIPLIICGVMLCNATLHSGNVVQPSREQQEQYGLTDYALVRWLQNSVSALYNYFVGPEKTQEAKSIKPILQKKGEYEQKERRDVAQSLATIGAGSALALKSESPKSKAAGAALASVGARTLAKKRGMAHTSVGLAAVGAGGALAFKSDSLKGRLGGLALAGAGAGSLITGLPEQQIMHRAIAGGDQLDLQVDTKVALFKRNLENPTFVIVDQLHLRARKNEAGFDPIKWVEYFPYNKIKENMLYAAQMFPIVEQEIAAVMNKDGSLAAQQDNFLFSYIKVDHTINEYMKRITYSSVSKEHRDVLYEKSDGIFKPIDNVQGSFSDTPESKYQSNIAHSVRSWYERTLKPHIEVIANVLDNVSLVANIAWIESQVREKKQMQIGTFWGQQIQVDGDQATGALQNIFAGFVGVMGTIGEVTQRALQAGKRMWGPENIQDKEMLNFHVRQFSNMYKDLFLSFDPQKPFYNKLYENANFGMKHMPVIEQEIYRAVKDIASPGSINQKLRGEFIFVSRIPFVEHNLLEKREEKKEEGEVGLDAFEKKRIMDNAIYLIRHQIFNINEHGLVDQDVIQNNVYAYDNNADYDSAENRGFNYTTYTNVIRNSLFKKWIPFFEIYILPKYYDFEPITPIDQREPLRYGACLINDCNKPLIIKMKIKDEVRYFYLQKSFMQTKGQYCWKYEDIQDLGKQVTIYSEVPSEIIRAIESAISRTVPIKDKKREKYYLANLYPLLEKGLESIKKEKLPLKYNYFEIVRNPTEETQKPYVQYTLDENQLGHGDVRTFANTSSFNTFIIKDKQVWQPEREGISSRDKFKTTFIVK